MTQSEEDQMNKSFSWSIESLKKDSVNLQFEFQDPSSISSGIDMKPDVAVLGFYNT